MDAAATPTEDAIYERMVATILDHRLPPGTKLVEDRLATAFGVSRTRIRPVLVRLAQEQLVLLTPNRGATVTQPTGIEAREVFEVRRMIEGPLVQRFIACASAADIAVLSACIQAEETAHASGDTRGAIRLAGEFHLYIAKAAKHTTMGRILRELVSRTSLVLMTYGTDPPGSRASGNGCGCQDHRGILVAIRLGDTREAMRLMDKHLLMLESRLRFEAPREAAPELTALFGAHDA
jgi:DNA-binding GntR family transcriptional regulator